MTRKHMYDATFTPSLLTWYHQHKRILPWRSDPAPYLVWVSEIMLQQTQIATVIPYFERFMNQFPTVSTLASADESTILKAWEGLGYYSRARNMQKAAKLIINDYCGKLPETYDTLQQLPGIGSYTAAAITSIAYGNPVPVVDGNVLRVFCRYWGITGDIRNNAVKDLLFDQLSPIIQGSSSASDFNQAIMELGALTCKPVNPSCIDCPLHKKCIAHNEKRISELPFKSPAKKVPHYDIAVALLHKNNNYLITQRKADQMLGNLWEFPGGKAPSKKECKAYLAEKIKLETGYTISVGHELFSVKHAFSHFKITIHIYSCKIKSGRLTAKNQPCEWASPEKLDNYPFPTANKRIITKLNRIKDEL